MARQARRNVALVNGTKTNLERFVRELSVEVDAKVTHSVAIDYLISFHGAVRDWLAMTDGPLALELRGSIEHRTEGRQP